MIDRFGRKLFENDPDATTGSSDFDDETHDDDEEYFKESHEHIPHNKEECINTLQSIVEVISLHVKKTAKPPTGNQNCQLCTWCTEARIRGMDVLPRPVYSPRDIIFEIKGENIVKKPIVQSLGSGVRSDIENLYDLTDVEYGRWYCHINWAGSTGGHEFILVRIKDTLYVVDSQAGIVIDVSSKSCTYFKNINWGNSYIVRLDDKDLNKDILIENNDPSRTLPWDNDKDIPYMLENGMLSDEDIQYLREEKGMLLDEEINESKVERINDKGYEVPEKCDKCGSHIGLYLKGEPVWLCSNKKCSKYFGTAPCNFQEATTLKTIDISKTEKIYYWSPIRLAPDPDKDDIITIEHDSSKLFVTDKIGLCPFYTLYDSEIFENITKKYNADIIPVLPRNLDELSKEENIVVKLISSEAKPRYGDFTLYVYEVDKSSVSDIVHDKKYKSEYLYTIPRKNGDIIVSTKPVKVSKVHYTIKPELSNTFQESTLPDGVFLRPANESDLPNIIKWKLESVNPKTHNDPKTIRFIENDAKENLNDTKMIMSYSTVIGVLESCYIDDGEWWYIGEIYLIPEYRGKGIARVILQQEIDSHDKLKLRVSKDNTHAIDLYKSLGFGISEEDEYAYTMTLVKDHVQEGVLNDLKNGVNPYSTKRVFHISRDGHLDGQVFKPRVPEYLDKYDPNYPNFEDVENPRVCFSPSIEGCLNAIVVNVERWKADRFDKLYVYVPEKPIDQYKHTTNKQIIKGKKVYDANLTREVWIEEPVRLKMYGVIKVDQISDVKKKSTVPMLNGDKGERNYYSYKWHWLIKPKVLDKVPYDYSPTAVCEDMVRDLKRYNYGIPVNGKVQNVPSSEYFDKHYKLLSPDEFEKYGGGVCWDYVEFMEGYLDAYGYSCKKYYISTDTKDGDTHTFITVDDGNGGLLYPESSFKLLEGLHKVKNIEEAIKMITSKMFEVNNNSKKYSEIKYYVWEYTGHPEYGSDCKQCTEYFSKGEPFYEGIAKNDKYIKEGYRMSSYPSRFKTDEEVVQEGMFDVGFNNLRMKISQALEGRYKVTNVFKGMLGMNRFEITSEDSNNDTKTTVDSTGVGCKVVSWGNGKMKPHFTNIPLSNAFQKIVELFEKPEMLLEGAVYMEETEETVEEPSELPEDMESETDDLSTFGTDDGDVHNDYDPEEIDTINALIASESSAVGEYFDAAKNSKTEILSRLYSDIGNEERFHLEQLMFAKATLTGEKYEPRDPDVKREYEELLAIGMDEETAMTTAIDKNNAMGTQVDDEELADLEETVTSLESAMLQTSSSIDMLSYITESNVFDKECLERSIEIFSESFFLEDAFNPVNDNLDKINPFKIIWNGYISFIKLLKSLLQKFNTFVTKMRIKHRNRKEFIDRNGIRGIFAKGIHLYFYSEKHLDNMSVEPLRFIHLMTKLMCDIGKILGLNIPTPENKYPQFEPISYRDIPHGMTIVNEVVLTKTKIVVNQHNEEILIDKFVNKNNESTGVFAQYYVVSDALAKLTDYCTQILKAIEGLSGNTNSVYYKDKETYDKGLSYVNDISKGFKKFSNAVAHDMKVLMNFNQEINNLYNQWESARKGEAQSNIL